MIDRLTRYYRERKVQPYASYEASRLAGEEMDEANAKAANPSRTALRARAEARMPE